MYILEFVNLVRQAQGYERVDRLPAIGGGSPLEQAMGCRFELGLMRMSSPAAAEAVAKATGQRVAGPTVSLPAALDAHASVVQAARMARSGRTTLHSQAV